MTEFSDEFIDFLANEAGIEKEHVRDAVIAWKQKQEKEKYLKVGDVVKIHRRDPSDYNGKVAFIGAVLSPTGTGFDMERSGKFSTYYLEPWDYHTQGDFLGYELEPTGKSITEEFLSNYVQKNSRLNDSMRRELQDTFPDL